MAQRRRMPVHKRRRVAMAQAEVQRARAARTRRVRSWRTNVFIAVLIVVALVLRAANLTQQSLWADEGNSVRLTERPLRSVIDAARADVHPPGYYLLLWGWVKVFGQSEGAVRAMSVVVGTGVVWLVYVLGKRVWNARVGWLAALCAAVSPFQVQYSQEVRMYIGVAFLGAASTYAFVRWIQGADGPQRDSWRWGAVYVITASAGLWMHYSFPIVLAALNVAWAWWWVGHRAARTQVQGATMGALLRWAALQGATIALYLPWLPTAWGRITSYGSISDSTSLGTVVGQWLKLLSVGESVATDDLTRWLSVGIVGLAVFGVWSGLGSLARFRSGDWHAVSTAALTLITIAPAAMMVTLELLGRSAYRPKFFLVASPAFCVLVGAGIALLERPSKPGDQALTNRLWLLLGIGLIGVASARSLRNYFTDPSYARSDYRAIAAEIAAAARAEDAILLNAPNQWEVFTYYYRGDLPVYPLCRTRPPVEADVRAELERIAAAHDRLYVLLWATDESDPDQIVERWLQENAFKISDVWYGDVRLAIYATGRGGGVSPVSQDLDRVLLGEAILLRGYRLSSRELAPGAVLEVTLLWEAERSPAARYKVFLHLLTPGGQILAQYDGEPGGGLHPTTGWRPQDGVFTDKYGLQMPRDAAAGDYQLVAGLYDISGAPRLPVTVAGESAGDAVDLGLVTVR